MIYTVPDIPCDACYDHVWRSRTLLAGRIGQKLRVVVVGTMNSALVEFEDGYRCVTSRFGYRRVVAGTGRLSSRPPAERE